jgi:transcriptional regulator with XRE-family HTH domain
MKNLDQVLKEIPAARRKKIEARAAQIVAEELTLRELRKAHEKTQTQVGKLLDMSQDEVSRLEHRTDLLLSTLRKYIEGMGGALSLIAEFPDKDPIKLAGLSTLDEPAAATRRAAKQ